MTRNEVMHPSIWAQVDALLCSHFVPEDDALRDALARSQAQGLPAINVAPNQGKLLWLLARLVGAQRILEVGTLGGYSAIWLARALRNHTGLLVTLESDAHHARVAEANLVRAGLADRVRVRVGPAAQTLAAMRAAGEAPFDLVFIDADKVSTPIYVEHALALTRAGGLIIVDNVVRDGAIAAPAPDDASTQGVLRFFQTVPKEPRIAWTALQTVGVKGYDGLAIGLVQ